MRKVLFDKIIGSDFKKTNYKVRNFNDLKIILEKQHKDLNRRLYKNNLYYEFEENEASASEIGYYTLMELYHINGYFTSIPRTETFQRSLIQRLNFMASNIKKIEFLENELQKLENEFFENPYNDILTPINYFNEIRSKEFFDGLWNRHKYENLELYNNFKNKNKIRSFDREDLMETDSGKGSFADYFDILQRFTIINSQLGVFKGDETNLKDISINIMENKYPRIFKHGYAFELLNYLISVESKQVGPAWASKFFLLFKDEKLIKNKARPSDFKDFLVKKYDIPIKTWDDRTSYGSDEESYLADTEKDFKNLYSIKRP